MNKDIELDSQLSALKSRFQGCTDATFFRRGDLLGISIQNADGSADILLQGAQLLEFTPRGEDRVIWCSDAVAYEKGVPLRGGVPICWPWFGPLANNVAAIQNQCGVPETSAPQHGFARNLSWELLRVESLADGRTVVELQLSDSSATQTMLDCPFQLHMRFEIGRQLGMVLTAKNTDIQSTMHFTSALHSYFAVSDIYATDVFGLDSVAYVDSLDGGAIKTQSGKVPIASEVDRIYFVESGEGLTPVVIRMPVRDIKIESKGSDSAIVWNPWVEKSRSLSQFHDTDYQHMLCVETANAFQNVISLAPGESHALSVRVSTMPKQ